MMAATPLPDPRLQRLEDRLAISQRFIVHIRENSKTATAFKRRVIDEVDPGNSIRG